MLLVCVRDRELGWPNVPVYPEPRVPPGHGTFGFKMGQLGKDWDRLATFPIYSYIWFINFLRSWSIHWSISVYRGLPSAQCSVRRCERYRRKEVMMSWNSIAPLLLPRDLSSNFPEILNNCLPNRICQPLWLALGTLRWMRNWVWPQRTYSFLGQTTQLGKGCYGAMVKYQARTAEQGTANCRGRCVPHDGTRLPAMFQQDVVETRANNTVVVQRRERAFLAKLSSLCV